MVSKYIKKILQAEVYDVAIRSPLDAAPLLSARLDVPVFLKREDLQPVFSFKIRGAYNRIKKLTTEELKRGVVTASAGNHAQGVALAASRLGTIAHVVMGRNTPAIKVNAVARYGGHVILQGDNYDEAAAHARRLEKEHGYTYVHPFDDPDVIAGQGTIGVEILNQHRGELHAVFVPIGGGGLISGVGTWIKYLRPDVRVIGVEAEGGASMWAAFEAGRRVSLKADEMDLFADGTAVAQVGKETFRLARDCVDDIIKVSVDEISAAVKDLFEDTRSISEPSGALSVAGLKKYVRQGAAVGGACIAIVSGANINFDRLRDISERTEIGEGREVLLGVTIPERPGSFKRFCRAIGKRAITEFNYRYANGTGAHVLVGIQTAPGLEDRRHLVESLGATYPVVDLSENEVAMLHVRYMVGGRASGLRDEHLFRFEFPEKPGALMRFLTVLGSDFNISMFHYRNHGAAEGRVLVGIQVPDSDMKVFKQQLANIGYRCWDETDNAAYQLFLM